MKKTLLFSRTATAMMICLAVFLSACVISTEKAYADESITVTVTGTYHQDAARSMLAMINEVRTSGDAWQYNSDGSVKQLGKLNALNYNYALEEIAMQRAAEAALIFGHTRPDGTRCFTCTASDGTRSWAENIAYGSTSASVIFNLWMETDEDYSGQGHRRNMLTSGYTGIGIGCITVNHYTYWVQEFQYADGTTEETIACTDSRDVKVTVLSSSVTSFENTSLSSSSVSVDEMKSAALPSVTGTISISNAGGCTRPYAQKVTVDPSWTSADTGIATVSGSAVTGVSAGNTTLTGSCGDKTFSVTATVSHVPTTVAGTSATCTAAGKTDGTKCSACGKVLQTQKEISALGHSYGDWVVQTDPTYTTEGLQTRTCSRCGNVETAAIPIPAPQVVITADTVTYSAPRLTDQKTGTLEEGTYVEYAGYSDGWYQLEDGSWVEDAYACDIMVPAPDTSAKLGTGTTTKKVTIYRLPSESSRQIATVEEGKVRNLYAQNGNWYQIMVTVNGVRQYGWVRADGFNFTSATTSTKLTTGRITADTPLYYGPGLHFETCGSVSEGRTVNIYEVRTIGMTLWYKVYSNGKYVWIDGNYLYDNATGDPAVENKIGQGTTTKKVKIYSAPDAGAEFLGTIASGKVRNLYAQSGDWYQIYCNLKVTVDGVEQTIGRFCWVRCDGFDFTKANTNASYATAVVSETTSTYYGHGYDYAAAVKLSTGTKVNVYKQYEDWYLVYRSGKYLWINGDYLKEITVK